MQGCYTALKTDGKFDALMLIGSGLNGAEFPDARHNAGSGMPYPESE